MPYKNSRFGDDDVHRRGARGVRFPRDARARLEIRRPAIGVEERIAPRLRARRRSRAASPAARLARSRGRRSCATAPPCGRRGGGERERVALEDGADAPPVARRLRRQLFPPLLPPLLPSASAPGIEATRHIRPEQVDAGGARIVQRRVRAMSAKANAQRCSPNGRRGAKTSEARTPAAATPRRAAPPSRPVEQPEHGARRAAQQRGPALDDGGAQLVVLTEIGVHDAAAAPGGGGSPPPRVRRGGSAPPRPSGRCRRRCSGVGSAAAELREERIVAGGGAAAAAAAASRRTLRRRRPTAAARSDRRPRGRRGGGAGRRAEAEAARSGAARGDSRWPRTARGWPPRSRRDPRSAAEAGGRRSVVQPVEIVTRAAAARRRHHGAARVARNVVERKDAQPEPCGRGGGAPPAPA